jgi:hypothetical protein
MERIILKREELLRGHERVRKAREGDEMILRGSRGK